jgi:HSP20 family protein
MGQATKSAPQADKTQQLEKRGMSVPIRFEPSWEQPGFFSSFRNEIERLFDDFGLGHGFAGPSWGRFGGQEFDWSPEAEVFERDGKLIVRADLPGMKKEDIDIDIDSGRITLRGERKTEYDENRQGIYRSERTYGSFYRTIPLPEGADADAAKASFNDGVLEIAMPLAEQKQRGKKLAIE